MEREKEINSINREMHMDNPVYAVILAGGHGTRFWPRSRKGRPKQLLDIVGTESMIQQTVSRIKPLIPLANILVVTNKDQAPLIKEHLPDLNPENIIAEPCGKNTAPALALAASILINRSPHSVMVVLTADHLIQKRATFLEILQEGIKIAIKGEYLLTLGITPHRPETGYGYIETGEPFEGSDRCYKVKRFVEKPDRKTAEQYLLHGGYLWNSGMFIWTARAFWQALEKCLPDMHRSFSTPSDVLEKKGFTGKLEQVYQEIGSISVDYGIMEKADNVLVLPADIGWNDVGSWTALDQIMEKGKDGSVVRSRHLCCIDTKDIIAYSPNKLVAAIGVKDLIIVDTEDAILVCHKERAQEIKDLLGLLEKEGLQEYL